MKDKQDIFFFFIIQNINNNCYIIFLKFYPIFFSWWENYSFQFIFINKRFSFCYSFRFFSYFFMIQLNCYCVLKAFIIFFIDRIYCWLFVFLFNQENQYIIQHNLNLFYNIYNAIAEHNRRKSHYLLNFSLHFKWIKKFFYNFMCIINNHDFYAVTLWMHYALSIII